MNRFVAFALLAVLLAGCGHEQRSTIQPDPPRSPATWPHYPSFSQRSCWPEPYSDPDAMMRAAPSFVAPRPQRPLSARMLVRRLLARFGDRTHVLRTGSCRQGAEPLAVGEFVQALRLRQPSVSYHLKLLRGVGLVEREARGTFGFYRLNPAAFERIAALLALPPALAGREPAGAIASEAL